MPLLGGTRTRRTHAASCRPAARRLPTACLARARNKNTGRCTRKPLPSHVPPLPFSRQVLNDHPFMSGWREWPLLGGKSVPFGSSTEGAPITALGNPGVHWPVAAAVLVASLGLAALGVLQASRGLAERAALVVGDEVPADEKERELFARRGEEVGGAGGGAAAREFLRGRGLFSRHR